MGKRFLLLVVLAVSGLACATDVSRNAAPGDAGGEDAEAGASTAADTAPESSADASPCAVGWSECSPGTCTNTRTVAEHCGACGYRCPNGGTCAGGECRSASGLTCPMGNADCDNNPITGCEAQLRGDHANCGTCRNDCTVRGLFCRDGACAP